jgi:phospholipid N-methyltransferase
VKVEKEVLAVLEKATTVDRFLDLGPVGALDRKLYVAVDKVLQAAGGMWNRSKRLHIFEGDSTEAIDQVLTTGEVTTHQDLNYFPTPRWLAARMTRLAGVGMGDRVLEPSAGRGAIVDVLFEHGARVEAVEQHVPFARELAAADHCRVQHVGDFLALDGLACKPVDAVVMNPPFVRQADIYHVTHALNFVRPGGALVSVMSNGVMFRDNHLTRQFRARVEQLGGYFTPLPEDSFKESGTGVRTVLLVIKSVP